MNERIFKDGYEVLRVFVSIVYIRELTIPLNNCIFTHIQKLNEMKKILLLVIGLMIAITSYTQTILTFKSHGLQPDEQNPMMLTKYVEPGQEGQNATWNFSMLEATNNFIGKVQSPSFIKGSARFSSANTTLEEYGNYFFFNSNSSQLEQYGFLSNNGSIAIEYSKPFVKMRYPFSFNSAYSGFFEGKYISNDKEIGNIAGSYEVTGDAIGTLILPEGKSFRNVLRVREVKSYDQIVNGSIAKIEEITYRWYVNEHRFPILVLIRCNYTFENGQTSTTTKAAYNSNVLMSNNNPTSNNSDYKLDVYPNPYYEKVNINLHLDAKSNVNITVYDLIGRRVVVLADKFEDIGDLTYNFSAKELGLSRGTYIVKVKVNNSEATRKILEL